MLHKPLALVAAVLSSHDTQPTEVDDIVDQDFAKYSLDPWSNASFVVQGRSLISVGLGSVCQEHLTDKTAWRWSESLHQH